MRVRPNRLLAAALLLLAALALIGVEPAWAAPPSVDRSTPRQSVAGFLRAVDAGELGEAKRYLDRRQRPPEGMRWQEVVEGLEVTLRERMILELEAISDAPEGDPADGADTERIGVVDHGVGGVPITLRRVRQGGREVWLFSSETIHRLPELTAPPASASWLVRLVPEAWRDQQILGLWSWQWLGLAVAVFLGLPLGYFVGRLLTGFAARIAARTAPAWDDAIVAQTRGGVRFVCAWLTAAILVQTLALPASLQRWVDVAAQTPLILAIGWLCTRLVTAVTEIYLEQAPDDQSLNSRGLRTQLSILRRLASVTIVLVTGSLVLMQFEIMRNVGLSLLASAGVAGVALGFAAKESLANVIAGLQLSVTQTIRLGDSVVVDGEWASVEEIALTYVRLRLIDDRRKVVPVSHLLTHPFENWSSAGDGLIGIVELALDPATPMHEVRAALERVAAEHPSHDDRECRLRVLDLDERRVLVRCRVSSRDLKETYQMRCDIREAMQDWLRRFEGGRYIARIRHEAVAAGVEGEARAR